MSSIQVNGQTSNTIIAGTKDDVTINGSCLGTATSAQTNGTGLQFLSIASTTDAQVNASFQADITASTGTHSVTLNTVNGVITASSSSQLFVTRAMLQSFSFSDSVPYNRDCVMNYTPMSTPIYPAPPASATVVCPQIGFAGDHAVYVSGNTMGGTAVFSLTPAPPQGLTGLYVEGTTAAHGTFTATGGVSITGGAATFSAPVSTGTPLLAGRTQFINPLEITWKIGQTGGSCVNLCPDAGTSSNPIYVTLAPSILPTTLPKSAVYGPLMLTYVKLAVGGGGAINQGTALANTWAEFSAGGSGPNNVRTWDSRPMRYYSTGFTTCATSALLAVVNAAPAPSGGVMFSESAQCGAFELLMQSALAVNGIGSAWTTIRARHQPTPTTSWSNMVVNNWCFIGTSSCPSGSPSYPMEIAWQYNMNLNIGDLMYPPRSGYGDLTNLAGLSGQNGVATTTPAFTPVEKVFQFHFVVKVPLVDGGPLPGDQYFDPSYGRRFGSEGGFENSAIAGYAYQFESELGSERWHVFRPTIPAPSTNILFEPQSTRTIP